MMSPVSCRTLKDSTWEAKWAREVAPQKNLRRKLGEHFGDRNAVRSVYGVGYGLDSAELE
jgi:hypothetical protein